MMSFTFFTFFLFGVALGRELPLCLKNEEYLECGTACPKTCSNVNDVKPTECVDMCISGCFCKEGFVRDDKRDNRCVPETDCKIEKQCSKNEIFSECGTLCPRICGDDGTKACPEVCVRGCVCQDGYIRSNIDGSCIPKEACNLITGSEEEDD